MQEMQIYGVSFDLVGKQPIVLLKTAEGNKFLPIWIGERRWVERGGRRGTVSDIAVWAVIFGFVVFGDCMIR